MMPLIAVIQSISADYRHGARVRRRASWHWRCDIIRCADDAPTLRRINFSPRGFGRRKGHSFFCERYHPPAPPPRNGLPWSRCIAVLDAISSSCADNADGMIACLIKRSLDRRQLRAYRRDAYHWPSVASCESRLRARGRASRLQYQEFLSSLMIDSHLPPRRAMRRASSTFNGCWFNAFLERRFTVLFLFTIAGSPAKIRT